MKRLAFTIIAALTAFAASAQNSGLAIKVAIPENSGIPTEAVSSFETRLRNIMNTYGIITDEQAISQFTVTARADVRSKNIVGSAPTIYAYDVDINLYVGDWLQSTQFETTTFRAKGTGQSEAKAYLSALERLNVSTPAVKEFLEKSKKRIIAYYNDQAEAIFNSVNLLTTTNQYEKAMYMLLSIPSFCTGTYGQAQTKVLDVYQKYIDYEGERLLQKATAIWIAQQNREGAVLAGQLLVQIEPASKAMKGAEALNSEIKKRIGQEWELELKKYNDSVAIEKLNIEAARQIGVAYGNGQKSNTTNFVH